MVVVNTKKPNEPDSAGNDKHDVNNDGKIDQEEYGKMTDAERDQYEADGNGGYKKKGG